MEIQIYYFSNEATVSGQADYDLPKERSWTVDTANSLSLDSPFQFKTFKLRTGTCYQITPSLMITATTQLLFLLVLITQLHFTMAV